MNTMPPLVLGPLHPELYQALVNFQTQHQLESLSQAIERILIQHLEPVEPSCPTPHPTTNLSDRLDAQVERLENCADVLWAALSTLKTLPPLQVQPNLSISVKAARSRTGQLAGLTGVSLAERLKTCPATISRRRSTPEFSQWSQQRDPDSLAWIYVSTIRRFQPLHPPASK